MFAGVHPHKVLRVVVGLVYVSALFAPARFANAADSSPTREPDYVDAVRKNIQLVLITPTKKKFGQRPLADVVGMANSALRKDTNLQAVLFGEECDSSAYTFTCLVKVVRDDYTANLDKDQFHLDNNRANPLKHWGEIRALLEERPNKPAKFAAVISAVYQADGSMRLLPVLIDTDDALQRIHDANERNKSSEQEQEALETAIGQYSAKSRPAPKIIKDESELEDVIRAIFLVDFRPAFEEAGFWSPYGSIEVDVDQAGLEIEIDGHKIGATKPTGRTVIGQVTAGERTLKLSSPLFIEAKQPVHIKSGETSVVSLSVERVPNAFARTSRSILTWGGVGVTAVGLSILGYAIAKGNGAPEVVCLRTPGATCGTRSEWYKFGEGPTGAATGDPTASTPIPAAPLGYSLGAMGLTWTISTLLVEDRDSLPWIELCSGLAAFLASLAISKIADGQNGLKCGQRTGFCGP
jgi:hypothetical protein